jgi:hypothetical protein
MPTRASQSSKDLALSSVEDRRASVRYPPNLEHSHALVAAEGEKVLPGRIQNLSAGGAAILLNRSYPPGTLLQVEVRSQNGRPAQTLFVRVAHAVDLGDGSYVLGGAFTEKPNGRDLLAMLE